MPFHKSNIHLQQTCYNQYKRYTVCHFYLNILLNVDIKLFMNYIDYNLYQ